MSNFRPQNRGVVLLVVLGTLLVMAILANVILNMVLSQSRHTTHQIGRIQAYYASRAGLIYAMEMLRAGTWSAPGNYRICSQAAGGCTIVDPSFLPYRINITIGAVGANPLMPQSAPIAARVDYPTPQ